MSVKKPVREISGLGACDDKQGLEVAGSGLGFWREGACCEDDWEAADCLGLSDSLIAEFESHFSGGS